MKYLVLLCDGMSDERIESIGNKTILEHAKTPNMDKLASEGMCGFIKTTPDNMPPGSDICNMSIFGYDPREYYTGRSPLEAVSMGVELGPNDLAFRCNLVTIGGAGDEAFMEDFSAGHIENDVAANAIKRLQALFKDDGVEFYQGLSYRHLMVIRNRDLQLDLTPPHDISGQKIQQYLPAGRDGKVIQDIIEKAKKAFGADTGKANSIWLWGYGKRSAMPPYKELYGLEGAVISAVDLIKGIGLCAGMDVINVPGATGFIDTNFAGKATYGVNALKDHDYVFIHVEAPDESGHMGNIEYKTIAVEKIDSEMLPIIMEGMKQFGEYRILITPDHPTPIKIKTHSAEPVPSLIFGTGIKADSNKRLTEFITPSYDLKDGYKIMELFLDK